MSDERVRLFVALELPVAIRDALVQWRADALVSMPALRDSAPLRLIGGEALHVTLCFLGWRTLREVQPIADACRVVASEPAAELSLGPSLWLGPRRPRVLAVELVDQDRRLATVHAALSRPLVEGGWYEPEARPFFPHVTVARVAKGARVARVELAQPPEATFSAGTVTLFRSRLSPSGARYEALHSVELDCPATRTE